MAKTAFITGAASGIGRATARLFVARGWRVGLADRDAAGLASLAGELGPDASAAHPCDVTDPESLGAALEAFCGGSAGRLDLLVKRYGDDLTLLHPETRLSESPEQAALDLAGRTVVLVDDVLYQGHSLARVVEWARQHGAARVLAAVLVDRRAQRLPIAADVVGLTLQIAPNDVMLSVRVTDAD
jgi:hypothetical protein